MKALAPFLMASLAVHALVLIALGFVTVRETEIAGAHDGDPDRVFVLVVSEEDRTAIADIPSPLDSPSSKPSEKEEKKTPEVEENLEKEKIEDPDPEPDRAEVLTKREQDDPSVISEPSEREILSSPPEVVPPEPEVIPPEPEVTPPEKEKRKEKEASKACDPSTASDLRMTRSSSGAELRDFRSQLLAALRQSVFFPREALASSKHGEVTLAFTVNRDRSVTSIRVVISSGCAALDNAAQEIVRKASQLFPEFTSGILEDRLDYTVPIRFKRGKALKRSRRTKRSSR